MPSVYRRRLIHVPHLYAKEVEVEWLRFRSFCRSHCGLKGSQWTVEDTSGGDCNERWPEYFVHNHLYFEVQRWTVSKYYGSFSLDALFFCKFMNCQDSPFVDIVQGDVVLL